VCFVGIHEGKYDFLFEFLGATLKGDFNQCKKEKHHCKKSTIVHTRNIRKQNIPRNHGLCFSENRFR